MQVVAPPIALPDYFVPHWLLAVILKRWVAQGGFAGDSVVPPEHRLAKFAGMTVRASPEDAWCRNRWLI